MFARTWGQMATTKNGIFRFSFIIYLFRELLSWKFQKKSEIMDGTWCFLVEVNMTFRGPVNANNVTFVLLNWLGGSFFYLKQFFLLQSILLCVDFSNEKIGPFLEQNWAGNAYSVTVVWNCRNVTIFA